MTEERREELKRQGEEMGRAVALALMSSYAIGAAKGARKK